MQLPIFIVSAMLFRYNLPSVTRTDLEFKFFFLPQPPEAGVTEVFLHDLSLNHSFYYFFSD